MKFELKQLKSKLKPNYILIPGIVVFCLILVLSIFVFPHFEIRNLFAKKLSDDIWIGLLFFSTCAILGGALLKEGLYKWFFIGPFFLVFLGVFFLALFSVLIPGDDNLLVKEDEVLYVDANDSRKKMVRHEYWTGIAGGSYNEDTLIVFEFSSWLRSIKKFDKKKLDKNWIPVAIPE